jgi:hypothetical protein
MPPYYSAYPRFTKVYRWRYCKCLVVRCPCSPADQILSVRRAFPTNAAALFAFETAMHFMGAEKTTTK